MNANRTKSQNHLSGEFLFPDSNEYITGEDLVVFVMHGWLVGCFGLKGPLRLYFNLYRAVSQR